MGWERVNTGAAASATCSRRVVGLSLWEPHKDCGWVSGRREEPDLAYLPSALWLIGLGHLGQAYLWALGLLPYGEPADVLLVPQDVDIVTSSTESTSILTDGRDGREEEDACDGGLGGVQKLRDIHPREVVRCRFQKASQRRLWLCAVSTTPKAAGHWIKWGSIWWLKLGWVAVIGTFGRCAFTRCRDRG